MVWDSKREMGPHFDYCLRAANNPSYFALSSSSSTGNQSPDGVDEVDRAFPFSPIHQSPRQNTQGTSRFSQLNGTNSLNRQKRTNLQSQGRSSFRSLLRSLSGKDDTEVDEGFLKGEARVNDVAPESHDVFYTMPLQGKRRHSVGGYLQAGASTGSQTQITSVPSEVPTMAAPKVNKGNPGMDSMKRKRIRSCETKEMEDIAILTSKESPEAELWAEYLITSFDKIMSQRARHHYRVTSTTIEDLITGCTQDLIQKINTSQLQIIIMCPRFLSKMQELKSEAGKLFRDDKILVMLLGVEKEDFVKDNLDDYPDIRSWCMMTAVGQDASFVDSLLTSAVSILRTNSKDCKDTNNEKTSFSVLPKKVKIGQNRVLVLLNEPLREEDSIRIIIERKGESIPLQTYRRRNPYTLQFDVPESCLDVSMLIWVKITKNGQSLGRRQIKCESRLRELDQILRASDNPMQFMCQTLGFKTTDREQLDSWMLASFQKNIPPNFHLLASSDHYNPKVELSSTEEYPTLLHFAAAHGLEKLCWRLLECPGADVACATTNLSRLTPAGLAAKGGHKTLANALRSHAQMNEFSNMYYYLKNMTENSGTPNKGDLNISELKIVEDSDKVDDPNADASTDPFSEECLKSLENLKIDKNIEAYENELRASHNDLYVNEPKTPNSPPCNLLYQNDILLPRFDKHIQKAIEHDYLFQPSNIKVEKQFKIKSEHFIYSPTEENKSFIVPEDKNVSTPTSEVDSIVFPERTRSMSSRKSHKKRPATGQEELAEIINDFKNNVFTISEVEKLVNDWRRRHETSQSLLEKQEQLDKMRQEYERLQKSIKDKMKRPTPFERVKKMFSKGKRKEVSGPNGPIEQRNGTRPASSLSESSNSSGRLSTVSGGSVGESSVQTEYEEKKFSSTTLSQSSISTSMVDIETKIDNYLVPPPPRPLNNFSPGLSTFGHPKIPMATIVERDVSQSREVFNNNNTHMRLNFDNACRSLPDIPKNNNSHLYMNVSPL